MQTPVNPIVCDGCARPASPAHIAERVARLESATRFRPVHINILFVAFAPLAHPENDFYGPPQSNGLFDSLLDALDIAPAAGDLSAGLSDFQRKGYYLSYLSECALPEEPGREAEAISALSPALIRRIRFNYKPKHIVLLGAGLAPLIQILEKSGLGPLMLLDRGGPVSLPMTPGLSAGAGFRAALGSALSTGATSENRLSDYDRMQSNRS